MKYILGSAFVGASVTCIVTNHWAFGIVFLILALM